MDETPMVDGRKMPKPKPAEKSMRPNVDFTEVDVHAKKVKQHNLKNK